MSGWIQATKYATKYYCLPGCEFNNSPISVDPLLHEVTNKVLTKAEVIFWDSSKCSGVGNVTFPLNISKDTFINKTNTRLTPWTSIWFVLVFVMVNTGYQAFKEGTVKLGIKDLFGHRKIVHYLLSKLANWSREITMAKMTLIKGSF